MSTIRLLLALFAACSITQTAWGDEGLRAGAATIDITPPTGFPMWGYAARHDAPSQAVLDPLRARALVIAAGDAKIALVALDLGRAPTRDSMAAIRKAVATARVDEVFLVASHTHHGPVLELDNWPTKEKSYVRDLEKKLGEVILKADAQLRPARIGVSKKETENLNHNRHSRRKDRPEDRELLVLRVEDVEGRAIAHAVNFAAHPTLLDSKVNKFSADFPGPLCSRVEKATGVPCLFLQGAAGDLSAGPGKSNLTPDEFGTRLAAEALKVIRDIRCEKSTKSTLTAEREDFRFRAQLDIGNPIARFALGKAFFPELIEYFRREYQDGVRPQLTLAMLNQRIGFVGLSGEFFCGHSLSLKRRARLEHLFVLGYCNDYQQYFPTIEAIAEQGYGTLPPISPVEPGAGEKMIDRALLRLYQMREMIAEPTMK